MSNPTAVTASLDPAVVADPTAVGGAAPAAPSNDPQATLEQRFKDTQAALTRVQQELAEFKKAKEPAADPAPPKEEAPKPAQPALKDPPAAPEKKPEEAADKEAEAIKEAAKTVDVDVEALRSEFFTSGDLSPESKEKALPLAEQFFSNVKDEAARKKAAQGLLDEYLEGRKAVLAREDAQFEALVGGKAEYDAMIEWAGHNLTQEEADAFTRQRNSGDYQSAALAVQGLNARYRSVAGRRPKLLDPAPVSVSTDGVYKTFSEYVKDAGLPAYQKDAVFRAKVAEKLQRSAAAGMQMS